MRLKVCEKMGWTFAYYDSMSAADIMTMLELWRVEEVGGASA